MNRKSISIPTSARFTTSIRKKKESLMDRMWSLYQQGKKPRPWPEGFDRQDYYSYKPCSFIDLTDGQVFDLGGRIVEVFSFPVIPGAASHSTTIKAACSFQVITWATVSGSCSNKAHRWLSIAAASAVSRTASTSKGFSVPTTAASTLLH